MAAIVAAILALALVYFGALFLAGERVEAKPAPPGQPVLPTAPCKTVTPRVWNRYVRILDTLTDRRHHRTKRKVCKSLFIELKQRIRQARRDCFKRFVRKTGASWYGYGDSGGIIGACGQHLMQVRYAFAVLSTGNVRSRCGQRLYFNRNGVTRVGIQADTDRGGGSAGGFPRTFDLWAHPSGDSLAHDLGLISVGLAAVSYSTRNCWVR